VAWHCLLLSPGFDSRPWWDERAVFWRGRSLSPIESTFGPAFARTSSTSCIFRKSDAAEAEFDADPGALLRRAYISPGRAAGPAADTDRGASPAVLSDGADSPRTAAWLTQADLDYYIEHSPRRVFAVASTTTATFIETGNDELSLRRED
jgi:hypothetical protein